MTLVRTTVEEWHEDEGWGVLRSPEDGEEGIWAHFSAVEMEGFVSLPPGQAVEVDFEDLGAPYQDGYRYRAIRVRPLP